MAKRAHKRTFSLPAVSESLKKVRLAKENLSPTINPVRPLGDGMEIEFKIEGIIVKKKYNNFVLPDFPRASAAVRAFAQVGIIIGLELYTDLSLPRDQVVLRMGEEIIAVIHLGEENGSTSKTNTEIVL